MKASNFAIIMIFAVIVIAIISQTSESQISSNSNESRYILISEARHIKNHFASDIYNEVKEADGRWSKEILSGEYLRVKFERELTSQNDITILPRIISGSPKIKVYEMNGKESLATFSNIISSEYNKIYLTNLKSPQDTFDLHVFGGTLQFDHIIDPASDLGRLSLYLNGTQAPSGCPTTSRSLGLVPNGNLATTWPGEFDSGMPGTTDAGYWRPGSANVGNTTASTELAGSAQTTRNSTSFGQGWIFNENLAGYRISQGNFTFNLSLMGGQGTTSQSERIMARISIVTCSGGNFALVKDITSTNIVGQGSHTGGQEGWRAQDESRFIHPGASSIVTRNINVTSNDTHLFTSGEYLLIEIGFGDGDSTTDRTMGLRYNSSFSSIIVPQISDGLSPIVDLIAPANGSSSSEATINFNATFSDNIALLNATLIIWNSSLDIINQTNKTLVGTYDSVNISVTLPYTGTFTWNYFAADNLSNIAMNSTNFTIIYALPAQQYIVEINQTFSISENHDKKAGFSRANATILSPLALTGRLGSIFKENPEDLSASASTSGIQSIFRSASDRSQIFSSIGTIFGTIRNAIGILTISESSNEASLFSRLSNQIVSVITTPQKVLLSFRNIVQFLVIDSASQRISKLFSSITQQFNILISNAYSLLGFRSITGNLILTESFDEQGRIVRSPSQASAFNVVTQRVGNLFSGINQQMNLVASNIRSLLGFRTITGNIALAESQDERGSFIRVFAQQIMLTSLGSVQTIGEQIINIVQTFIITPLSDITGLFNRQTSNQFAITAATERLRTVLSSIAQPFNIIANSLQKFLGFRSITGNVIISENSEERGLFARIFSQQLSPTEATSRLYLALRTPLQILSIETFSQKARFVTSNIMQSFSITNAAGKLSSFSRIFTTQITFISQASFLKVGENIVNLVQSIIILPDLDVTSFLKRISIQNIILSEITGKTRAVFSSITQQFSISLSSIRTLLGFRTITGNVILSENSIEQGKISRAIMQTSTFNAAMQRTANFRASLASSLNINSATNRLFLTFRNSANSLTIFSLTGARGNFNRIAGQQFNLIARGFYPINIFLVDLSQVLKVRNIVERQALFFRLFDNLFFLFGNLFGLESAGSSSSSSSSSSTSSSGGGGGSGFQPSGIPIIAFIDGGEIALNPDQVIIPIKVGEVLTKTFQITNRENSRANVEIISESPLIEFSETKFSLNPGETREISIDIIIKENISPGLYLEKVVVKAGAIKEILFAIEVSSKEPLFDVKITIPPVYKKVSPGKSLLLYIEIFNLGQIPRVDAEIEIVVRDKNDKTIITRKESLAVETQTSLVRELFIPAEIPYGEYFLYVKVDYSGNTASALETFEVGKTWAVDFLKIFVILNLLLTLAVLGWLTAARIRRYKSDIKLKIHHLSHVIKRKISSAKWKAKKTLGRKANHAPEYRHHQIAHRVNLQKNSKNSVIKDYKKFLEKEGLA